MAILALHAAATGMTALSTKLDVTANNLANVNTDGFKGSRVNFQDLLYVEKSQPGVENANGDQRPMGTYVGLGVKTSGTQLDFRQGPVIATDRELDIMIEGDGFFQIQVGADEAPNGIAYTRAGNFTTNENGEIVLATDTGRRLEPVITIPNNVDGISISIDGRVSVLQPGATQPSEIGQIQIADFANPSGLKQIGENLYIETAATGPALTGEPAQQQFGGLRQGLLEGSNVDPTMELISLIRTQRAFEMNSQSIRTADEVLRQVAALRQ
ncbi:MAG: flagellar basal-body rod protein FlgG [Phycisphaeraceae bacterium]|nr:flagellar basal-body rod protein FlgG [Phycisphaeraceae bacterium]MCB9847975.1 flagellar basal-body rod protein FlgG [Phycisphaeraceae bacterium]